MPPPGSIRTTTRSSLRSILHWLQHGQSVVFMLLSIGLFDLLLWTAFDFNTRWLEDMQQVGTDLDDDGYPDVAMLDAGYALYIRTLLRLGICLAPAFIAWFMRHRQAGSTPVLPISLTSAWLGIIAISIATYHGLPAALASSTGDEPYAAGFAVGIALTGLLFMMPAFATWLYGRASTLDRYVVRTFLTPFLICFSAFVSIWLISDLADNGPDFSAGNMDIGDIATLYAIQLPAVTVLILPITLLLALLYALGSMSRRNELVSMMIAGRSVQRILRPLFWIGGFATFISLVCNFQWAPNAAGTVHAAIDAASAKKKSRFSAYDQTFVNRAMNRIWFVGRYPQTYSRDNKLESILVAQFSPENTLLRTIHADKAYWQRNEAAWVFFNGQITHFDASGEPISISTFPLKHFENGWPETPWRIVSSGLNPEFLGIPQIGAYLRAYKDAPPVKLAPFRTHWQYRLALPFTCMIIVLFGAPLGIVYSRRGLVGSVTAAVILFFISLFLSHFFVALGQSNRLPPILSAWLPPVLLASLGFWLLHLRSHNRELPSPVKWLTARRRKPTT